ncbi:MAG: hypothetical protein EON86_13645 [Brevundimonas sp.]|nr:MAG: hypothetical protein EON86_13645 [Brevundimonas sp.]
MGRPDRSLHPDVFAALKAEVLRAAVELSDEQLMDLTDALHGMKRLRRPGRPISHDAGWLDEEKSPSMT